MIQKNNISIEGKNHKKAFTLICFSLLSFLMFNLSGCSTYQPRYQSHIPTAKLPEVNRPQVQRPKANRPQTKTPDSARAKNIINKPKPTVAKVQRYTDKPKKDVITQTEVRTVLEPEEKAPVEVASEASPYENIPDSEVETSSNETSPAVRSLMLRARADMAIGQDQSAITKLERALRIESTNPDLWYLLAKAHQSSGNHQQAITMAKKSINFSGANESFSQKELAIN
ncbi:hypothetical protein GQR58_010583 [Nymphon striatum]|nr:hypothetical protein GQR58_010583 [Nymphon striatum]